jgi:hypothetical protein
MEKTKGQLNGETKVPYVDGDAYSAITKREYIATQAMNSLASNEEWAKTMKIADDWEEYIKRLTEGAVEMADALLEALSKP